MRRVDSLEKTDAGRDWGQEEKEVTENKMLAWHHLLSGHQFKQTSGDSEGQESLMHSNAHKQSDMT